MMMAVSFVIIIMVIGMRMVMIMVISFHSGISRFVVLHSVIMMCMIVMVFPVEMRMT